jgi:glucose-6-phosphate isomerase
MTVLPSLHEFNLNNGLSSTREPIRRTLSKMKGMFHDEAAFEAQLARGDSLLYEFYDMGVPDSEKDIAYGTSITYPARWATNTT